MSYILEVIKNFLLYAPAALICISFHEASHGLVAYWLGDNTAKNRGRLTVNPLAHIDIMGLVCMIVFHFGWARPVPVDPRNFKRPKVGMALTALAGPVSNLLLSLILMCIYVALWNLGLTSRLITALAEFLFITAILSCGLAVFNLLPVPPLDGSRLLLPLLPNRVLAKIMPYEDTIRAILMVALLLGFMDGIIGTAQTVLANHILAAAIRIVLAISGLF